MKYRRLAELRRECNEKIDKIDNENMKKGIYTESEEKTKIFMKMDSLDNFFECETYKTYESILEFCRENNIRKIYDIGCAYGLQSEIFIGSEVNYVGIDEWKMDFWNKETFKYINKSYPFKIEAKKDELAVSSLCLTWNCYLYEGNKTLIEQCEALQRDFKHCLLYISKDKVDFVSKYFKSTKIINNKLVYFSN